jgi:pyruvate/2-oxoglutarate dehydrogenase complex dihydrolipoamide dehydrogenase (E3) component
LDVVVIGAGPAGLIAALRAAEVGARTALVARNEVGGMAGNDGPVPVRTLAQAARLLRETRQLGRYGISVSEPILEYPRLLARVREVVRDVREHSTNRKRVEASGVTIFERAGTARFVNPATYGPWT